MDYRAFFAEIAGWVEQCNELAAKHGMDSDEFWKWVTQSSANICEKYGNNPLVNGQMSFLFQWLDDVYRQARKN